MGILAGAVNIIQKCLFSVFEEEIGLREIKIIQGHRAGMSVE